MKESRFTLVELCNDATLVGFGICTYCFAWSHRSLLGLFWSKEDRVLLIDILYLNFEIKVK